MANQPELASSGAHQFTFHGLGGEPINLGQFAGKAIMVVNTASECGFTPQYSGLEALWQGWKERGLVVLGVPSNDFGGQEPGSNSQIKAFCDLRFHVSFPMTEKTTVTGNGAHPFYKWIGNQVGLIGRPHWNFYKYIIGADGRLVDWYSSITKPQAPVVAKTVERALQT